MKRAWWAATMLLLAFALPAQVAIIRTLPDAQTNPVEPEWSQTKPRISSDGTQPGLSGRLTAGASAVSRAADAIDYSAYLDGEVALAQELGPGSYGLSADVSRAATLAGLDERYAGGADVEMRRWALSAEGEYRTAADPNDPDDPSREVSASAEGTVQLLETLPFTVGGAYAAERKDDTDVEEVSATLEADGSVAEVGVALSGSHVVSIDETDATRRTQTAGALDLLAPVGPRVGITASVAPSYSDATAEQVSLDSAAGVILGREEGLRFSLAGGRSDSWAETHRARWTGSAGVSLDAAAVWASSAGYTIAVPTGVSADESVVHSADLAIQWAPEAAPIGLEVAGVSADVAVEDDTTAGGEITATFAPASDLRLTGGYTGSFAFEAGSLFEYGQSGRATLRHTVSPLFDYSLGARREGAFEENDVRTTHSYEGQLVVSPYLGWSRYPFSLGETYVLEADEGTASTLTASATAPVGEPATVRYEFSWERLNVSATAVRLDTFRHALGFALAAERTTLTADYAVSHGENGVRHDLRGSLDVPVRQALGARVEAELSRYTEDDVLRSPFLIRIASTYEF